MPQRQITVNSKPSTTPVNVPMYDDDLELLDMVVDELRKRDVKYASRARVMRLGLQQVARLEVAKIAELLEQMPATRPKSPPKSR